MIKKLCAVYDVKSGQYDRPLLFLTLGEAERSFADAVKDPQTLINKHPADFRLDCIGSFDTESGELIPNKPVIVVEAAQLVTQ